MFRKIAFVSAPMFGASMVTPADTSKPPADSAVKKIRPSDLPIYSPTVPAKCTTCKMHGNEVTSTGIRGNIESGIGVVREGVFDTYKVAASHTHRIDDYYQTGKEHTRVLFDYLNEPSNSLPRAGAIALGGASGFILGLRHGFIRRVLYTGIGTAALASICYPKDAEIYAQKALVEGKAAAKIAYNFAYGVKPGTEPPNFPKIPSNVTEVLDRITGIFSSAKDMVSNTTKNPPK